MSPIAKTERKTDRQTDRQTGRWGNREYKGCRCSQMTDHSKEHCCCDNRIMSVLFNTMKIFTTLSKFLTAPLSSLSHHILLHHLPHHPIIHKREISAAQCSADCIRLSSSCPSAVICTNIRPFVQVGNKMWKRGQEMKKEADESCKQYRQSMPCCHVLFFLNLGTHMGNQLHRKWPLILSLIVFFSLVIHL